MPQPGTNPTSAATAGHGALALVALASATAGQYWLVHGSGTERAGVAWAVAAAAFVALYALDRGGRELPAADEAVPRTIEWPLALLVLATGIFFRTFRLSELPPGLNHDVAWNGLYAIKILQGVSYTPYVAAAWGRETLMMYLQALGIQWFGRELFALIFPAMVAMIVMLPVFYGWVRRLFGTRAALTATFFLAAAGWPLVFGRIGWRAGLQPLFVTLTCLFFWRAFVRASVSDFVLAGVSLAVTLNTYNAARSLPLLFPLFVIAYLIRRRQVVAFVRRYWLGILVFCVAFGVCIEPLAHYAWYNWDAFQGRAGFLYTGPREFGHGLRQALLLFNRRGNGDDFFIETPLLELPAAVLFVFGVLWCALRLRDERALFLLLGLAVSLLPGIVTKPNGNRCIGAMPFVYVFVGLGLLYFVRLASRLPRAGGALALGLLTLAVGAQARATYAEYLGHDRRPIWGFYPETTVLGHYLGTLVGKYAIWVGGTNFPRDTLTFFSYPGDGNPFQMHYTWLDDVTALLRQPPEPPPGQGLAVIMATNDTGPAVFTAMLERFPAHQVVDLRYPPDGGAVFARALLVQPAELAHEVVGDTLAAPKGTPLWTGGLGYKLGNFNTPKGLARDRHGEFYVADTANHRIQKFDATGAFVTAWGQLGSAQGSFNEPSALAVDAAGDVHVVDTWNDRVQKFSPDGRVLAVYAPPKGFYGPRGIAIARGKVYVTDGGNNFVDVFDVDGHYLRQFGGPGTEPGQLTLPVGVAVDHEGLVWVVDSGNNRLEAFRPNGSLARLVPVPGWHDKEIKEGYLAMTSAGLVLSDPGQNRLLVLHDDSLVPLATDRPLSGPSGLAADGTTLYVSERGGNVVTRVRLKREQ